MARRNKRCRCDMRLQLADGRELVGPANAGNSRPLSPRLPRSRPPARQGSCWWPPRSARSAIESRARETRCPRCCRSIEPWLVGSARCASGTSSTRSTSPGLGVPGRLSTSPHRPREAREIRWQTSTPRSAGPTDSTEPRLGAKLLGILAQRCLADCSRRFDHAARQAHLAGMIEHVGGSQNQRHMPGVVLRIEQHQHRGRTRIVRRGSPVAAKAQLGLKTSFVPPNPAAVAAIGRRVGQVNRAFTSIPPSDRVRNAQTCCHCSRAAGASIGRSRSSWIARSDTLEGSVGSAEVTT